MLLLFCNGQLHAQQPVNHIIVKDGKMIIELSKNISTAALDNFIAKHNLQNLGLRSFIENHNADSLKKQGWKEINKENKELFILSMSFSSFDKFNNPAEKIMFSQKNKDEHTALFPAVSSDLIFGYNKFKNKYPFAVNDSVVTFFLKGTTNAKKVMLAGSFNNWNPNALSMIKKDSGWIAYVRLGIGKYWYKFVVDGNWTIDHDNTQNENDNRGNINSVYYKTNILFALNGYKNARKISVAGSFNKWQSQQLLMNRTASGWQLPVYLANGTYTYRFVQNDDDWFPDPANPNKVTNEFNNYNSVISIGKPHLFVLNGFTNAHRVTLVGSFNNWKDNELSLIKTATGWQLPYVLGPGNYEYRYLVDNKEMGDPTNPVNIIGEDGKTNGYLVVEPNYTFKLTGYSNAKSVSLAGDFNNWNPHGLPMRRDGNKWAFSVHLNLGKHLYKFIVDGQWIKDPNNKLWEQNEYSTGNSIIWIEQ
jgi:hypothetical protein